MYRSLAVWITTVVVLAALAAPARAQDAPAQETRGWYIGVDAGVTHADFGPGLVSFYTMDAASAMPRVESTIRRGSGYGWYTALAVEKPHNPWLDFTGKLHLQTRAADFVHTTAGVTMPQGQDQTALADLRDNVRLEVTTFGFEILARAHLPELPALYALAGPSVTWVMRDRITVRQTILAPPDVYYNEPGAGTANRLRTVHAEGTDYGFESWFPDLILGVGWTPVHAGALSVVVEGIVSIPLNGMPDHDEIWTYPDRSHLFPRSNPNINDGWDEWNPLILRLQMGLRYAL